jgi:Asp/Glu/hydantoin racemase
MEVVAAAAMPRPRSRMKRILTFVHTSPAAIGPLMQFYSRVEPDWEITNLLDDGILRFIKAGELVLVEERLREMLAAARTTYEAEAVLVTCSSVPSTMVRILAETFPTPVLKIDDTMAQRAVETASRIGVAVTFAPTEETTRRLLTEAAAEANRQVKLDFEVIPAAYDALLTNDLETHDRMLIEACERLASRNPDMVVLAQVSMARTEDRIRQRLNVPVLSSLTTSVEALRKALA